MRLYQLSDIAVNQGLSDVEIRNITDDTRELLPGDMFVCIKGATFDGHTAAADMLEKGAAAIVTEHDLGLPRQIIVKNTRKYYCTLASRFYGEPTKKLKLIAATGTNGKSTIVNLIAFLLNRLGAKCGSLGTIGYDVCGRIYEAHLTTPRPMDMYRYFSEMVKNGAEYCALEASSQALAQYRIYGEEFEAGIFTNLTRDHLDVHGSMENYYKAKKSLFKSCKRAVISIDDSYGQRLAQELKAAGGLDVITYSTNSHADYYGVNLKTGGAGSSCWLSSVKYEKSFPVKFSMPGLYNISNGIAAIAVCAELGFPINECVKEIQTCPGIRGRTEAAWDGDFTVICDYAHTSDGLEKFLTGMKAIAKNRIICLFAAAGERDETKREDMGRVVGRLSDIAVLTSDNPRFEDPEKIIRQVEAGLIKENIPYKTFVDRREAIEYALNIAQPGDIVTLCGKGHETYQVIGDKYLEFDERKIVKEIMRAKAEEAT